MNRRNFVTTAALGAASIGMSRLTFADDAELQPIFSEIKKLHDEIRRIHSQ